MLRMPRTSSFPLDSLHHPPVTPSVPVAQLLGHYLHPSYGSILLKETEGQTAIHGSFPGRLPLDPLYLEHIDGDTFLLKADLVELIPVRAKATFKIDSKDSQPKLGVHFADDITTWFVRTGNEGHG